nr:hypothetical protein [Desulfobacula sp.]
MKNPFTFSNIVTGPDFCNRKKEQNPDIKALYIDLYGTTSERECMTRIFQQLNVLESGSICFPLCSSPRAGRFTSRRQAIRFMRLKRSIIFPG